MVCNNKEVGTFGILYSGKFLYGANFCIAISYMPVVYENENYENMNVRNFRDVKNLLRVLLTLALTVSPQIIIEVILKAHLRSSSSTAYHILVAK